MLVLVLVRALAAWLAVNDVYELRRMIPHLFCSFGFPLERVLECK